MTKIFLVVNMVKPSAFVGPSYRRVSVGVIATRSTHEKAEKVIERYIQTDLLSTVTLTILEAWTNEKPKPEWDND